MPWLGLCCDSERRSATAEIQVLSHLLPAGEPQVKQALSVSIAWHLRRRLKRCLRRMDPRGIHPGLGVLRLLLTQVAIGRSGREGWRETLCSSPLAASRMCGVEEISVGLLIAEELYGLSGSVDIG